MAREKKFNFVTVAQILDNEKRDVSTCSFNAKQSMLTFSKNNLDIDKYTNKFVKLYVDQKKRTLAWKFFEHENVQNMVDYLKIKEVKAGEFMQVKLYVPQKVTKALGLEPKNYKHLEIGEYQDSLIAGIPSFYYITFPSDTPIKEAKE